MNATTDRPGAQEQKIERRRPRAKRLTLALLGLALAAIAAVALLTGQALLPVAALEQESTTADAAAQPLGTPPAGMPARPGGQNPGAGVGPGVPLTATLVVIIRHMLLRYRRSKFFLEGSDGSHEDDPGMSRAH